MRKREIGLWGQTSLTGRWRSWIVSKLLRLLTDTSEILKW